MTLALLLDPPASGALNMRRDLELLDAVICGSARGTLRLYGFSPPCLSLGRLQSLDDVDVDACARDGIDVVQRPTGGRAVLHDAEVTYSVTCSTADARFGGTVLESCARIHRAVAEGLRLLGVKTIARAAAPDERAAGIERAADPDCFSHAASHELLDETGRKLVGSAQARRAGGLLQHGSILLEPPRAHRYLRASTGDTAQRGGGAGELRAASDDVTQRGGGIHQLLGRAIDRAEVVGAISRGFRRTASG